MDRGDRDGDLDEDDDEGYEEEADDDLLDEDSQAPGLVQMPSPANVLAGRIEMLEAIGEGGMGTVWRGYHLKLEREVAVKILDDTLQLRVDGRERFLREARALGRLDHPGIVRVFDCDELEDGRLFLCMELLAGEPLKALRERGDRLTPREAIEVGIQICDALQAAHTQGILHRDLSASNIMLLDRASTRVKVIDWGLCKYLDFFWSRGEHRYAAPPGARLRTPIGARFGTPEYMAPELIRGDSPSPPTTSTDVYALGVVLFELLTATRPFRPGDRRHPRPIAEFVPDFDAPALEAAIFRAIAHEPARRTQTMVALREELEACREVNPGTALSAVAGVLPLSVSAPLIPGASDASVAASSLPATVLRPVGWFAAQKSAALVLAGVLLGSSGTLTVQRASTWYEHQVTAPLKSELADERTRVEICEDALSQAEDVVATFLTAAPVPSSTPAAPTAVVEEAAPGEEAAKAKAPTPQAASVLRRRISVRTLESAGEKVRACYDRYGGSKVAAVQVRVTIEPGGRARDVRLVGDTTSSALLRCVAGAVQEHRYAPGPDTLTVRHTFALRKP